MVTKFQFIKYTFPRFLNENSPDYKSKLVQNWLKNWYDFTLLTYLNPIRKKLSGQNLYENSKKIALILKTHYLNILKEMKGRYNPNMRIRLNPVLNNNSGHTNNNKNKYSFSSFSFTS